MGKALSYSKLELLPEHLKSEVNDFIDFLLSKEERKKKKEKDVFSKLVGSISDEEAAVWKENINEGCGKIDEDGW
jgi:predicted CopG family antitoxin